MTAVHEKWTDEDLHAWAVLAPLSTAYVPWSAWAMRPLGLVQLLNAVVLGRPSLVVECGSGVSTFYLARLFEQLGHGRTLSIEHDAEWAAWLRARIADEGLEHRAEVLDAPLDGPDGWYDEAVVRAALGDRTVDVLVVDGPPAAPGFGPPESRHPALRVFRDALAPGATVLLDDAERDGERAVLARWREEHGVALEPAPGGIALGVV